ncbi:DNA polymerase III subunit beta [Candidatus Gottesmanbacteria bacterium]|nr:DNA polymerase III subunit beta [Candidatus Gottesmanbacteria bacterium]
MKVTILQENLIKALTAVSRIIPMHPSLPILQNILFQTKDERIMLFGTSLDTGIVYWCDGKTEEEGIVCVPAKVLSEFVATLPAQTVTLEDKKEGLVVSCAGFSATIATNPATEFPPVPIVGKTAFINIKAQDFSRLLGYVLFAAATDEARPILSGVRFTSGGDEVVVVATDGYRLSRKKMKTKLPKDLDVIIPGRALSEIARLASGLGEDGEVGFALTQDGQILFHVGEAEVFTRRIDGEYPPVEKIIPKNWTTRATIDREALAQAVKSAAIFARDNANIVRVSIQKDAVVVSANAPSVGENKVDVEARIEGEEGEIAFNSRFLLEYFSAVSSDQIAFEMTGSLNPGAFRPVGDDSYLHIIMPVRVQT